MMSNFKNLQDFLFVMFLNQESTDLVLRHCCRPVLDRILVLILSKIFLLMIPISDFVGFVVVVVVWRVSTPGQTQTGLGPRVYPFTTPDCCTAWIRCWHLWFVHSEPRMPSLARLSKRFRAAGTNGRLDLSLTWPVSEDPLNRPCKIWSGSRDPR